jgi:hypothetical protein
MQHHTEDPIRGLTSGRPEALARYGEAALQAGRYPDAFAALEEAVAAFRDRGDIIATARTMGTLSRVLSLLGDERWAELRRSPLVRSSPVFAYVYRR